MKKKFTKLEKELLDIVQNLVFYGSHSPNCAKNWYHNGERACTCAHGYGLINGNIILNKYGLGFYQHNIDKIKIEKKEL